MMTDEEKAENIAAQAKQIEEDYPEYPTQEAQRGNVLLDPANPKHQTARLRHSGDYVEDPEVLPPGYQAPEYA
jgi:hypothetical protein